MNENTEYASKGVGAGALTTGIIGTAGAVLSGAFGNILGGGMGGGNATLAISERDAKIARLESEKYSDGKTQELYNYITMQNEKLSNFLCGVDKRLYSLETAAPLREQILDGKIAQVADKVACCCSATNAALANLSAVVNNITKVVIPNSAICPGWGNVSVAVTPTTTTTGA
ncbi:MAG: hypothetical protein II304_00720 [Bacteroidales bacterium]|nr:hypothetical protein [Bacteroidales bacterium]